MFRFSLFSFPVRVHWTFGLLALFISGGLSMRGAEDWPPVLTTMAVIFISILVHELGHALAGRRFGAKPSILLHSMGGLCYLPEGDFNRNQSIIVSLAGPAAGFLLAGVTFVLMRFALPDAYLLRHALAVSLYINLLWTILNLLPVLPLDGGQVFREILGPNRIGITRRVGAATAAAACLAALYFGLLIGAVMAAALAYINFRGNATDGGVVMEGPPEEEPASFGRR